MLWITSPIIVAHSTWRRGEEINLHNLASCGRLLLQVDFTKFRFVEGNHEGMKLLDVAIGPLDL